MESQEDNMHGSQEVYREYNALWEKKRHWFNVLVEIWNKWNIYVTISEIKNDKFALLWGEAQLP